MHIYLKISVTLGVIKVSFVNISSKLVRKDPLFIRFFETVNIYPFCFGLEAFNRAI